MCALFVFSPKPKRRVFQNQCIAAFAWLSKPARPIIASRSRAAHLIVQVVLPRAIGMRVHTQSLGGGRWQGSKLMFVKHVWSLASLAICLDRSHCLAKVCCIQRRQPSPHTCTLNNEWNLSKVTSVNGELNCPVREDFLVSNQFDICFSIGRIDTCFDFFASGRWRECRT